MRFLLTSCFLLAFATPFGMGQAYSPYGFHSSRDSIDITAETMTRDDSADRCIRLKGRVVVRAPGMTLYADELIPTSGCGGFVPHGNIHLELAN
jgi:hypothetical protein